MITSHEYIPCQKLVEAKLTKCTETKFSWWFLWCHSKMIAKTMILFRIVKSFTVCLSTLTLILFITPSLTRLSLTLTLNYPLSLTSISHLSIILSCMQFDYLIVFPLTEGVYTDPLYRKGGKEYGSRISWSEVAHTWSKGKFKLTNG